MKKINNSSILKRLVDLGRELGTYKLKDLAKKLGIGTEETLLFIQQVFPHGIGVEVYFRNGEYWIDFKTDSDAYLLSFSLAEWVYLHQLIQSEYLPESTVLSGLRKKVSQNSPLRRITDLLSQSNQSLSKVDRIKKYLRENLEEAIRSNALVKLESLDKKILFVYPWRVIHLDGELSLIAEESQDHSLIVWGLREIKSLEIIEKNVRLKKITNFEIDEFICALRSMSEKETRLILKIQSPEAINLFPDNHFLGKPCLVTNPVGDLIWAAYVEPCDSLYDWIMGMGSHVEILDPIGFKEEYLTYCRDRIKKIA